MALIEVRELSKAFRVRRPGSGARAKVARMFHPAYETRQAVDGVSFDIDGGEIVGYLGANGAGKSTTVKCLAGILVPDGGTVRVAGLDPVRERIRLARRIGVVFGQKTALWWDLPVAETFTLLRAIYEVPPDRYRTTLDTLTELLGLADLLHIPVRQLSLGQRVRADLAAAFLHGPDVLFLDEPTIGLDAMVKSNVRRFIKDIRTASGVTVLLTTHDLADLEQLCDRLVIIDRGRVLFAGSVEETLHRFAPYVRVMVEFAEDIAGSVRVPQARATATADGRHLTLEVPRGDGAAAAVTSYLLDRFPVRDLRLTDPSIEDVVRVLYEGASGAPDEPAHV